eukprot:jgi/Galph1/866/GphlegSOOS_G5609.1
MTGVSAAVVKQKRWKPKHFSSFISLKKLSKRMRNNLETLNISHLFRFQWSVFCWLERAQSVNVAGDIIVQAPTGTGKTLCYVVPIVQALDGRIGCRRLRALVIVPTRELVVQVEAVFRQLMQSTSLTVVGIRGGKSMSTERNQLWQEIFLPGDGNSTIVWNTDVLVSTPSRLLEHIHNRQVFDWSFLEYLVLDETDRLLSGRSLEWMKTLLKHINDQMDHPKDRILCETRGLHRPFRKLLFSATQTTSIIKLQLLSLCNPILFTYGKNQQVLNTETSSYGFTKKEYWLPVSLKEQVLVCQSPIEKLISLVWYLHEIGKESCKGVIIFTNSTNSAHRLYRFLTLYLFAESEILQVPQVLSVAEFSSVLPYHQRNKVIRDFCNDTIQILVSSDVAARGTDIQHVDHVVNFDVSSHLKTYLHRVGRTARAGRSGCCCSVVLKQQAHHFKKLLSQIQRQDKTNHLEWKEMKHQIIEWSTLKKSNHTRLFSDDKARFSVVEVILSLECCLFGESKRLLSNRKPLSESIKSLLVKLGRKHYKHTDKRAAFLELERSIGRTDGIE